VSKTQELQERKERGRPFLATNYWKNGEKPVEKEIKRSDETASEVERVEKRGRWYL
jgi:hypothetical protein